MGAFWPEKSAKNEHPKISTLGGLSFSIQPLQKVVSQEGIPSSEN
jgi:hypothetical protein